MRYPLAPKLLTFGLLVVAASACFGLQPEHQIEEFEVLFKQGESTLAPSEIKKFSGAFDKLKQHGWCIKQALAIGITAPGEASTDPELRELANNRSAYLKKVLAGFEPLDDRTYAESKISKPGEPMTAGLTSVTIIGYRC